MGFRPDFQHDLVRPAMSPEELDSRIQAAADLLIGQHPVFNAGDTVAQKMSAAGALMNEGIKWVPVQELTRAVMEAYVDKFKLLDILGSN